MSDNTYAVNMIPVVIDINVFVADMGSGGRVSREVLRRALGSNLQPLFGNAQRTKNQDLLGRPVWGDATTFDERQSLLAALARDGRWVTAYSRWRPNLPDDGDNLELALASSTQTILHTTCETCAAAQVAGGNPGASPLTSWWGSSVCTR